MPALLPRSRGQGRWPSRIVAATGAGQPLAVQPSPQLDGLLCPIDAAYDLPSRHRKSRGEMQSYRSQLSPMVAVGEQGRLAGVARCNCSGTWRRRGRPPLLGQVRTADERRCCRIGALSGAVQGDILSCPGIPAAVGWMSPCITHRRATRSTTSLIAPITDTVTGSAKFST